MPFSLCLHQALVTSNGGLLGKPITNWSDTFSTCMASLRRKLLDCLSSRVSNGQERTPRTVSEWFGICFQVGLTFWRVEVTILLHTRCKHLSSVCNALKKVGGFTSLEALRLSILRQRVLNCSLCSSLLPLHTLFHSLKQLVSRCEMCPFSLCCVLSSSTNCACDLVFSSLCSSNE